MAIIQKEVYACDNANCSATTDEPVITTKAGVSGDCSTVETAKGVFEIKCRNYCSTACLVEAITSVCGSLVSPKLEMLTTRQAIDKALKERKGKGSYVETDTLCELVGKLMGKPDTTYATSSWKTRIYAAARRMVGEGSIYSKKAWNGKGYSMYWSAVDAPNEI